MKRRLYAILAGMSFVLCVASMAMWGRSYWTLDSIGGYTDVRPDCTQRGGNVNSAAGAIWVEVWTRQLSNNTIGQGTRADAQRP